MAKLCETHEISQRAGRSLHRLRLQELPPSNLLLSGWTQGIPNLGEHTCQCGLKGSQSARKSNCNQSGDECILNRRNPFVFSQESCSELFHFRPRNFSISFVFTLHVMKVRSVPWPMILSFIDLGSFALPHHFIAAGFKGSDYVWPSVRYRTSLVKLRCSRRL